MKLTVNGVEHEIASPPLTPLLHVLRDELDITSPKAGCQQGGCGTCTVLVDGEPRRSCLTAVATVDGASITTLEGLGEAEELSPVQAAFHDHYAAQCGFCTPGMVVAATALIERKGGPVERDDVLEALGGHYCRCTGYVKIVDAVHGRVARRGRAVDDVPVPAKASPKSRQGEPGMKAVGARLPRYDGVGHVTGRTQYVDDVRVGRTLWVKALRSPHHHAAITKLDTSKAEAMKGVHAIVTHADVPKNVYGHLEGLGVPGDEPLLADGEVRYKGQPIAAVAAESEEAAHAAVEAIEIALRGAPRALRHPPGARPRRAADPPVGQRLSALRPVQPPPRAQGRHRRGVRRGRRDRRGRLPPAGDRADAAGDAGRARGARRRAAG